VRDFTQKLRKNDRMIGRIFGTRTGNRVIMWCAAVVGLILSLTINEPRTGTMVFVAVTAVESGVFSAIYGLRSDWRQDPASRAVFWAVFAYFLIAAHLVTLYGWTTRYWWTDDLRELLYLGLVLAGLNLVLTLVRVLGRRVYRNH
jgi:FtsH-binding integral membrane protein